MGCPLLLVRIAMGINRAPWGVADCACCPPGGRKETVTHTTALPSDSRHAFLLAVRAREVPLPREVLQRIFALAATVERRVVTNHAPPTSRRHKFAAATLGEFDADPSLAFGGLCLDADDAPI